MVEIGDLETFVNQARLDFEVDALARPLLRQLYSDYNPEISDVESFLDQASSLFPAFNCGLATVYLKSVLGRGQVIQGRYGNEAHTFLLVDGEVADITADQFGGPAVYIGEFTEPWGLS